MVLKKYLFEYTGACSFVAKLSRLVQIINGNYLGELELLAEYNAFLAEHLKTCGNKGRVVLHIYQSISVMIS